MAKPKVTDFKKKIAAFSEADLRAELLKLFTQLPQVRDFYATELLSPSERLDILNDLKKKIENQFWTRTGNPRDPDSAAIRKIISDFEKTMAPPPEMVDLILHRVETATKFAHEYGGMPDSAYNTSLTAFDKAVKLIQQHDLLKKFREQCHRICHYNNLDYWYLYEIAAMYEAAFGEKIEVH